MSTTFTRGCALLIGVSDFQNLESLPRASKDVEAFHSLLTDPHKGGYEKEKVQILRNKGATRADILRGMDHLETQLKEDPQAVAFLCFSGNGFRRQSDGRYFLVSHDFDPSHPEATAVEDKEWAQLIGKFPEGKVLLLFDTAHAGYYGSGVVAPEGFESEPVDLSVFFDPPIPSSLLAMASCKKDELSFKHPQMEYGIFALYVMKALIGYGKSSGEEAYIYAGDLGKYCADLLAISRVVEDLHGMSQRPEVRSMGEGFAVAMLRGGVGLPEEGYPSLQEEADSAEEDYEAIFRDFAAFKDDAFSDASKPASNDLLRKNENDEEVGGTPSSNNSHTGPLPPNTDVGAFKDDFPRR